MDIAALIEYEKERVGKRKDRDSEYNRGRITGYNDASDPVPDRGVMSSEVYVEIRSKIRDLLKGSTRYQGNFRSGYIRSLKNVYSAAGHIIFDPSGSYHPVTQGQFRLIALIEQRGNVKAFYGLTSEEAHKWIKEVDK